MDPQPERLDQDGIAPVSSCLAVSADVSMSPTVYRPTGANPTHADELDVLLPWALSEVLVLLRRCPSIIAGKTLPVVRSEGRVECSAEALYDLLISNDGYRLLNPSADPKQFNKPFLGPFSLEAKDEADGSGGPTTQRPRTAQLERATMKVGQQDPRRIKSPTSSWGPSPDISRSCCSLET